MVGGKIYKVCGLSRGEEIQDREREAKIQGMRLINYHEYLDTRYVVEARRYKIKIRTKYVVERKRRRDWLEQCWNYNCSVIIRLQRNCNCVAEWNNGTLVATLNTRDTGVFVIVSSI